MRNSSVSKISDVSPRLLVDKPQSFQDIHPLFIKELGGWQKYEKAVELSDLLEQNRLCRASSCGAAQPLGPGFPAASAGSFFT